MPQGLLWSRSSAAELQQEGIERRSTSIWCLTFLTELCVLYFLKNCDRMCQHNSSNNDSVLMSATGCLTACPTTMERTKMYESWKQFKRKPFQKDSREWPPFFFFFFFLWALGRCFVCYSRGVFVRPPHELRRPWPWSQLLSKTSKHSVCVVPHTAVVSVSHTSWPI